MNVTRVLSRVWNVLLLFVRLSLVRQPSLPSGLAILLPDDATGVTIGAVSLPWIVKFVLSIFHSRKRLFGQGCVRIAAGVLIQGHFLFGCVAAVVIAAGDLYNICLVRDGHPLVGDFSFPAFLRFLMLLIEVSGRFFNHKIATVTIIYMFLF